MHNLYRVSHWKNKLLKDANPAHKRCSLSERENYIAAATVSRNRTELFFANTSQVHRAHKLKGQQWFDENDDLYRGGYDPQYSLFRNGYRGSEDDIYEEGFYSRRDKGFRGDIETLRRGSHNFKHVIAIEHLARSDKLCCASSKGNVWCYDLSKGTTEEVAKFEHGIAAMQWSPDHSVIVFVDKKMNMFTMDGRTYTQRSQVELKKGTFRHRMPADIVEELDGQGAANQAESDAVDEEKDVEEDYQYFEENEFVCITWAASGKFFAVSFKAYSGLRMFKIFTRDGVLKRVSEPHTGLYSSIAWQRSGRFIAMPQITVEKKFVIALFRKTGKRDQTIWTPLYQEKHEVESVDWSSDSEALAVVWYTLGVFHDLHVFIYTMENNQWYLKQDLAWTEEIFGVQWDRRASAGKTLHLITDSLLYERITFEYRVDRSLADGEDAKSMVAVIDGNRLHLSAFQSQSSRCDYTLTLPEEVRVNDVGFIRFPGKWSNLDVHVTANAFFVVDSTNRITFYDVTFNEQSEDDTPGRAVIGEVKKLLSQKPRHSTEVFHSLFHWLWLNPDHVVLSYNNYFVALNLRSARNNTTQMYKWIEHRTTLPFKDYETIGCVEALGPNKVLIELTSGRLMEVAGFTVGQPDVSSFTFKLHGKLPAFCEQLCVDQQRPSGNVYALSHRDQTLYHDGVCLASKVLSMFLIKDYLLYTTMRELHLLPLGVGPKGTVVDGLRLKTKSRIVMMIQDDATIFFQRRKLEVVKVRYLALGIIAKHLEQLQYREAFVLSLSEQLDLNLLVDHDVERFLEHLGTHFVPQITNESWLKRFIKILTNHDVCQTMYASNYPERKEAAACLMRTNGYSVERKVQFICERLLDAMGTDPTVLTLPKITCYVKLGELEKALSLIWALKKDNPMPEPAEEALRYLIDLKGNGAVNDEALGMYDLELATFVAKQSHKSPKKLLKFFNVLRPLEEEYRKYRIDCHLRRYDRALTHISRCDSDANRMQEALDLIFAHDLFKIGIECYKNRGNEEFLRKIYERYAVHLCMKGDDAEASLMYERAGDMQQAINSARIALDWRRVLLLSARSTDPEHVQPVLRLLVPALVKAGEHDAAATIAHEHLKDLQLALDCLLKGHQYERALLLVASSGEKNPQRDEMIREHVRKYLNSFKDTLATDRKLYLQQKERLLSLRNAMENFRQEVDAHRRNALPVTRMANTGRVGAKNRRIVRQQLLRNGKKNPFEVLTNIDGTIDELHTLVVRVCGVEWQRKVCNTCQLAIELRFDDEARTIQRAYGALFELISSSLDAIWIPEMILAKGSNAVWTGEQVGVKCSKLGLMYHSPANLLQAIDTQRYALIKPHQRYKPDIQSIAWQLDIPY